MVGRQGWERTVALLVLLFWLAQPAARALAAETEQRDFAILVDGKEAGQSRLLISAEKDGTTVVTASAKVHVNQIIFHYSYKVESTETWRAGKLAGLRGSMVENGKRTEVAVAGDGNWLRIKINGQERLRSADAWTSSFWKLADPRYHNKSVPI